MSADYERLFQRGDAARWRARYPRTTAATLVSHLMAQAAEAKAVAEAAACCTVPFDVKTVTEAGEFEGLAAVYHVKDEQGDVIEPGAFAVSLSRRPTVPILWQHDPDQVLGVGELVDTPAGLKIVGKLNLAVARAKEIYALLRQGALKGLSIGFRTIRADFQGAVRHVREIALYEVSLTAFPAQAWATVSAVKSEDWDQSGEEADLQPLVLQLQEMRADIAARAALLREMRQDLTHRIQGGR